MFLTKAFIFLALLSLSECMFRPPRPPRYQECSCENHEEIPCDDGEPTPPDNEETTKHVTTPPTTTITTTPTATTKPTTTTAPTTTVTTTRTSTTTTTPPPTTTVDPCLGMVGVTPFRRAKGYWCSQFYDLQTGGTYIMSYKDAAETCRISSQTMSSLETEEERRRYGELIITIPDISGFWVGAALNTTTGQYYWNDGQAVPTMDPQPIVREPGQVAFIPDKTLPVPGYVPMTVVDPSGKGSPNVNSVICGVWGAQFN